MKRYHPSLLACVDAVANGARSVRAVSDIVGLWPSTVWSHLLHARQLGLVEWDDNRKGTLRPAGSMVVVRVLCPSMELIPRTVAVTSVTGASGAS